MVVEIGTSFWAGCIVGAMATLIFPDLIADKIRAFMSIFTSRYTQTTTKTTEETKIDNKPEEPSK